jgi:hypothetical protein
VEVCDYPPLLGESWELLRGLPKLFCSTR